MRVTRRQFLAGGTLAIAGCARGARLDAESAARLRNELAARAAVLRDLVPISGPFTTPAPAVDLLEVSPTLRGVAKLTHRLHPTPAAFETLMHTESHFGGPLDWPGEVAFPVTESGRLLLPVLQLKSQDAPGQAKFKPGSDLLHLFWDARSKGTPTDVRCVWGNAGCGLTPHPLAGLGGRPDDETWLREGLFPSLVPVPAKVHPERLLEFPGDEILPERMKAELYPELPGGVAQYRESLSVALGSKVGGYEPNQPRETRPACVTCTRQMHYLLTISDHEYAEAGGRWQPTPAGSRHPLDLKLGARGAVNVFVCRRCEDWPVAVSG